MNITIGTTTLTQIQTMLSATFVSLLPLIAVMIAVPLTFYAIRKIIALFPAR